MGCEVSEVKRSSEVVRGCVGRGDEVARGRSDRVRERMWRAEIVWRNSQAKDIEGRGRTTPPALIYLSF